ncbi:MAG: leucine-rich repeat domain-containing protein [Bacteroidota bacterium]
MIKIAIKNFNIQYFLVLIIANFFSCQPSRNAENAFARSIGKKEINLSYCGLTEFPLRLLNYPQLETITIHHNRIKSIPPEIFKLKNLKKLFIGNNKLSSLPSTLCENEELEVLSLRGNEFSVLPDVLFQMNNLIYLDVSHNQLTFLNPEIGNLKKLTRLFLDFNYLNSIPKEIGELQNLQIFSIGKNQIDYELPKELENLKELFSLNVAFCGNEIVVPNGVSKLQKLEYIYIDNRTVLPGTLNQSKYRLKIVVKVNP